MARPKSEDKKQALLEAATAAFAQSGIAASTSAIARSAGVAEGTLFRYFATKDELLNELYLAIKLRLAEILGGWTQHIYRIGPQVENNGKNMPFAFINDPDFAVFEYIIPLQMVCARLPPVKGIDPAIPKDPHFHQKMKSKQLN